MALGLSPALAMMVILFELLPPPSQLAIFMPLRYARHLNLAAMPRLHGPQLVRPRDL